MNSVLQATPFIVKFTAASGLSNTAPMLERVPMHAIFLETGSNEAYTLTLVSVTDDFEAGQAWVDKMNAIYSSLQKKRQLLVLATLAWRELNPMPPLEPLLLLEHTLLPTDLSAPPEEREDKHRINNENFLRNLTAREPQREWSRQEAVYSKHWLAGNLTDEEVQMNDSFDEKFWSIKPVAWHISRP